MREVTILADDLTGALDASAAFASPSAPVLVGWDVQPGARIAVDSETRAAPPSAARATIARYLPQLADSAIAFKKVDSLLRGNTFAEIAACCSAGAFDAVYIAPAFPDQGRTTEAGWLRVHRAAPGQSPVSIPDRLLTEGIAASRVPAGGTPPDHGVAVCDAATVEDLRHIVRSAGARRARTLWCGSAGLAYAFGIGGAEVAATPASLAILGSRHPSTRLSFDRIRQALGPDCVEIVDPERIGPAIDALAGVLRHRRRAVLAFGLPEMPPAAAEACYRAAFSRLVEAVPRPERVIAVGGDTVHRLVGALGALSLVTLGHRSPGLPVSRIEGGAWDGTSVTSKSGAFGEDGLFADFFQEELKSA